MSTNKKRTAKDLMAMDAEQLAEATKQFDEELIIDKSRPLTKEDRTQWNKAKRKRGRPKIGKGVTVISVSVEKGLLAKADRLAKRQGISRAKLITYGLETVLGENSKN